MAQSALRADMAFLQKQKKKNKKRNTHIHLGGSHT